MDVIEILIQKIRCREEWASDVDEQRTIKGRAVMAALLLVFRL